VAIAKGSTAHALPAAITLPKASETAAQPGQVFPAIFHFQNAIKMMRQKL
jgi:hypothetical protein